MTDMPEEIWAWPARLAYEEVGQWATTRYPTEAKKFIAEDVVEARIAEAVAKEREACARIIDEKSAFWNKLARNTKDAEYRATYAILASTTRDDAKAIRSRT